MKKSILILLTSIYLIGLFNPVVSYGQSPEISLREFASSQIKKGVRSIGMGSDGATWGNYALVWRDSASALVNDGITRYTNGNVFTFTGVGAATPTLWHGLTIYTMAISQYATNIALDLKSPGLGKGAVPVVGNGSNSGLFIKAAMPLGNGFSVGVLLSDEHSLFSAVSDKDAADNVRYQTKWLPSGGFGVTWQPISRILVGFRGLFNNDNEVRTDNLGTSTGLNASQEYRLGISVSPWHGALIDIGGNIRYTSNQINNTSRQETEPNIGFEQTLFNEHFAFRFGLDETSGTAGFSLKFRPVILHVAYINNISMARLSNLFGTNSNSLIATLVFNYSAFRKKG